MLRNYCKIALRNMGRNQFQTAINVVGLALGMTVSLLIALWLTDELTFDHYHTNHRRIGQVLLSQQSRQGTYVGPTVSAPLGVTLQQDYRDLFERVALLSGRWDIVMGTGDKNLSASCMYAQPELPEMFTFDMVRGAAGSLKDPTTLLIDQSTARALFGDADPMDKSIRLNNDKSMRVGGVFKDLPRNTTFNGLKVVLPWSSEDNWMKKITEWNDHDNQLFVQLRPGVTFEQAEARIRNVPTPHVKEDKEESYLQPLDKLHFVNEIIDGQPQDKAWTMVWVLGLIGVFILLLACINFMNLSTARSERRAREVGIRKTVGTTRSQLVVQFLVESVLVTGIAAVLAVLLAQLSMPWFNDLSGKDIHLPVASPFFWATVFGMTLLVGVIAGSYPAFYLSSFKPMRVLKGILKTGNNATRPREVLVVFQFAITLMLVIATIVAFRQIEHAKDRPLGYNQSGLVTVGINTKDLEKNYPALRDDLMKTGMIDNMARSSQTTLDFWQSNELVWEGMDPSMASFDFRDNNVDYTFGETIGWHLLMGRDFSSAFPSDSASVILNQAAVRAIGNPHPLGMVIKYFGQPFTVIGVVQDIVERDPFTPPGAAAFFGRGWKSVITLRIKAGVPVHQAIARVGQAFRQYNPGSPFIYSFNDDDFGKKFLAEERAGKLAGIFALLAIVISCLGLFGLASFMVEQRTKEIGVRKVLGAGVLSLWTLLSKDFVKLAAISLVIAIPAAWWFLHNWLSRYPIRTTLSWWIFAAPGVAMMVLALATVSVQCLRTAMRNPIGSLRRE
jgi:ABC-type antimicrobial peptide transport system permease subunit